MTMNRDQLYGTLTALLRNSSPHPDERALMEPYLPDGGTWDKEDNYTFVVPGESKTLFACHLDTVGDRPKYTKPTYIDGFIYAKGNNVRCLGGDDRCGILILLALISEGIPGTYIFHNCEEKGAGGANFIEKSLEQGRFNRAIEFDRRGTQSIITEMSSTNVCSKEFSTSLAEQIGLNYKEDPTGLFTDVYFYRDSIPEVTNISVGYFDEHSPKESIAVLWLIDELIPALMKVKWEDLPTIRDPKKAKEEEERLWQNYCSNRLFNGNRRSSSSRYSDRFVRHENGLFVPELSMYEQDDWDLKERSIFDTEEEINWYAKYGIDLTEEQESINSKSSEKDEEESNLFGVCDSCNQESFLEPIGSDGSYLFCSACENNYFDAIDVVEDSL